MSEIYKEHVSVAAASNISEWLTESKYEEYRDELLGLIDAEKWQELEDAFFKKIEFGTGGIRGTTGIGSNRINRVTVGEAAQALCIYAARQDDKAPDRGIVIACDTRLTSPELSKHAAVVCAANGFRTYLFNDFRSTPELSFAVRELGAAAGIVISASHNPAPDNGFKAYWSDGAQLVAPHDKGVLTIAASIEEIHTDGFDEAVQMGKIKIIGESIDIAYIAAVVNQAEGTARDLHVIYSPLHGAGQTNTLPVLRAANFSTVSVVEDQMSPDGNFPTIEGGKANPEEAIANNRAVAQLLAEKADIAITNDPDADRIGIMVREGDHVHYINGNQAAVLAADFALSQLEKRGELTQKHYLAKTIVTTDMLSAIADHYGVQLYGDMLIGFKYIGALLREKESTDEVFVLGGEESYGLLKGDYARDKDGAVGALVLAEYAAELKRQGKTMVERLHELYAEHGLYLETLDSTYFYGADGFKAMQDVMKRLRDQPPKKVGSHTVTALLDYQSLKRLDTASGKTSVINCLAGNVVALEFNNDPRCRITIRPSGTEPKLKFYVQWWQEAASNTRDQSEELTVELADLSKLLEGTLLDE